MAKDDVTLEISIYSGRGGEQLSKSTIKDMAERTKHPGLSHLAGAGFGEVGVHFPRAMSVAEGADALFDKMGSLVKGKSKESPSASEIAASFNTLAKDLILTRSMSEAKGREGQYNFQLRTRGKGAGVSAIPFAIKSAPPAHKDSLMGGVTPVDSAPHVGDVKGNKRGGSKKDSSNAPSVNNVFPTAAEAREKFVVSQRAKYWASSPDFYDSIAEDLRQGTPRDKINYTGQSHQMWDSKTGRLIAGLGGGIVSAYDKERDARYAAKNAPAEIVFNKYGPGGHMHKFRGVGGTFKQGTRSSVDPLAFSDTTGRGYSVDDARAIFARESLEKQRLLGSNLGSTRDARHANDAYLAALNATHRSTGSRAIGETIQKGVSPSGPKGQTARLHRQQVSGEDIASSSAYSSRSGGIGSTWWDVPAHAFAGEGVSESKPVQWSRKENRNLYNRTTSDRYDASYPPWLNKLHNLLTSKPSEGSSLDILDKSAKPRPGGQGSALTDGASGYKKPSVGGGDSSGSRRGLGHQMAEQFRHAAVWGAYTPFLAAGGFAVSRMIGGDPYTDRAAHSLIGVGLSQKERDDIKDWGVRRASLNPYTTPQEHIGGIKEVISGLGIEPTPGNMYGIKKASSAISYYSQAMMAEQKTAARSLSRIAAMSGKISAREKGKSNAQLVYELANTGAAIGQTSSITDQEMSHAFRVAGPSMLGKHGLNWSKEESQAFIAMAVEGGIGEANLSTVVKHMGSGVPFYEQLARTEIFMDRLRDNFAKKGALSKNVPYELLQRGYLTSASALKKHPEDVFKFRNLISEKAKLMRSGDQAAVINEIQRWGTNVSYIEANVPNARQFISQTDIPVAQWFAGQPKGEPAKDVKDKLKAMEEAKNTTIHAETRARKDNQKSAKWSKLWNVVSSGLSTAGDYLAPVGNALTLGLVPKAITAMEIGALEAEYQEAVIAGDKPRADYRFAEILLEAKEKGINLEKVKRSVYYSGISAIASRVAKEKGVSSVTLADLPSDIRKKLTQGDIDKISSGQESELRGKISDLPAGWPALRKTPSDEKFELPKEDTKALLEALGQLPKEFRQLSDAIRSSLGQETNVTVNTDDTAITIHSNKSGNKIPPVPKSAPGPGKLHWGKPPTMTTGSSSGGRAVPSSLPNQTPISGPPGIPFSYGGVSKM